MTAPALSPAEVDALPRRRRRWVAHVAAAATVAGTLLLSGAAAELFRGDGAVWWLEDLDRAVRMGIPGLLLLPAYRRVGFRRRDALFFVLIPFWGLVIAWKVGFRLAALPYRDWSPRPEESPHCRRVPGTPYHVVIETGVTAQEPAARSA